jgi:glyoxylase-like metal-dependent hydrolase (beta-lactamase superfamily II)
LGIVAAASPGIVAIAQAQSAASAPVRAGMVDQFYRGRAVINAAVQAAGGAQALRAITALSYVAAGDVSNDIQGYSAARIGNPARDGGLRIVSRFDFSGARFYQQIQQHYDSGYDSAFATIWRGGVQYAPRWVPRDYTETANAPSPFAAGGAVMISSRWLPPIILQRALQNFRTTAWVGESMLAEGPADIVEFSFDEFTRFRVHVARATHKIRRVEAVAPDPISADDVSVAELSGDQTVAGVIFPTGVRALRRGAPTQTLHLTDVAINPVFSDADFSPPEGFTLFPAEAQVHATQIAGRVYEVSGLAGGTYQVPFVVMDDFVVAYEAPLGISQTRQVIAEIRRVAGDKPIRYVVVSHFHADHAGGVGAYVDIGATVLSSPENQVVLQTYAASNRPQFQGLEGPRENVAMQFQPVPEGGFEIVDGAGSRLRVIDFAGASHVDHMLALHDPETGVFMGADHYIEAVLWNPTFERVAAWVRNNRDVATLLGVHVRPTSRAEYLAIARGRRNEPQRNRITWEGLRR